jgi:hypothetical protein
MLSSTVISPFSVFAVFVTNHNIGVTTLTTLDGFDIPANDTSTFGLLLFSKVLLANSCP